MFQILWLINFQDKTQTSGLLFQPSSSSLLYPSVYSSTILHGIYDCSDYTCSLHVVLGLVFGVTQYLYEPGTENHEAKCSYSLWVSSPGRFGKGAGKGRRACDYIPGIWIPLPLWLPVNWAVRSLPISTEWKQAQMTTNTEKHVPRVMMSLLMSSSPISILHQLLRCRYSISRDIVASSPSLSLLATRGASESLLAG